MNSYRPWPKPTTDEIRSGKFTDSYDLSRDDYPYLNRDMQFSKEYYDAHLKDEHHANGDADLMAFALNQVDIDGLYCEFGTWEGHSINVLAGLLPKQTIYGFDVFDTDNTSFKDGKNWNDHDFTQTSLPDVKSNVILKAGWFNNTLPGFVREHPEPFAFIHMDGDNYDAAKDVLDYAHIVPGTIILWDEYINVPNWTINEFKAWKEYCFLYNVEYDYIGINSKHQQVAMRVRGINFTK